MRWSERPVVAAAAAAVAAAAGTARRSGSDDRNLGQEDAKRKALTPWVSPLKTCGQNETQQAKSPVWSGKIHRSGNLQNP